MIKKILLSLTAAVSVLILSACNGIDHRDGYMANHNNYIGHGGNNFANNLTTLFLSDERGLTYGGIPYICDSMRSWDTTMPNGAFSFIEPDTCEFDFNGLEGVYGDDFDDIVRIVDFRDHGKRGIGYECAYFGASSTYGDGSFDYDEDDICTFYL